MIARCSLLVRQGNLAEIQLKLDECITQALIALGGADSVPGVNCKGYAPMCKTSLVLMS